MHELEDPERATARELRPVGASVSPKCVGRDVLWSWCRVFIGAVLIFRSASAQSADEVASAFQGAVTQAGERFSVRYSFERSEELEDFETRKMGSMAVRVEGGDLQLAPSEESESRFLGLRDLHFASPFSLSLKFTPKTRSSGLVLIFADSNERFGQTWVLLNALLGGSKGRVHGVLRVIPSLGASIPEAGPNDSDGFEPEKSLHVRIDASDGALTVTLDGVEILVDKRFDHRSCSILFGPDGARCALDDLVIEGKVVPATLRKFVRGRRAENSEAARALEEGRTPGSLLAQLQAEEPLSIEVRELLEDLEPAVRSLALQAYAAEGVGEWLDAALIYTRASILDPEAAVVAWRSGRCFGYAGDRENALLMLRLAIQLDEEFGPAWRDLGWILTLEEQEPEAYRAFQNALALTPSDPVLLSHLGRWHQGRAELELAKDFFTRAAESAGSGGALYRRLVADLVRLSKPPQWGDRGYVASSKRYELRTDVSKDYAEELLALLEVYRDYLERVMPLPAGKEAVQSRVWVFDSRGEYNVFSGTLSSRPMEHTAGVYHTAIKTLLLYDDVDRESTLGTLFHEAFHQYVDQFNGSLPICFNEGMAEFFGGFRVTSDRGAVIAPQQDRLLTLRRLFREHPERVPDLDDLLRMKKSEFYAEDRAAENYALGWSVCHFFMTTSVTMAREGFAKYSELLLSDKSGEEAYAQTFGKDGGRNVNSFRGAWRRHVDRMLR